MKRLREQRRAKAERAARQEGVEREAQPGQSDDGKSKTGSAARAVSQRLAQERAASSKKEKRAKRRRSKTRKDRKDAPVEVKKPGRGRLELTEQPSEKPALKLPVQTPEPAPSRRPRLPAPPLPAPQYTELEQTLQRSLTLQVVDLGPGERWKVSIGNRGSTPVRLAVDPRLLSFEAVVPGKAKPVTCRLPEALLPREDKVRYRTVEPGQRFTFDVDPLMYCFESGDQTILVPGTFLTPSYGFSEKTKTRWSWGRPYEERLPQDPPFSALPTREIPGPAPRGAVERANEGQPDGPREGEIAAASDAESGSAAPGGLKRVVGEGFALRSEYQGWAQARVQRHTLGDRPNEGLKLTISHGSDAPSARDVTVTVRLENQSSEPQRVYFRRDLVSFIIDGPDGEHRCEAFEAELRAPDPQAFTTIAPRKAATFTTQLLEFCPAESFSRPGFYYVSAVLPGTARGAFPDEDVFTGKLAASKPRPVRLHRGELPYLLRRNGGGGGGGRTGGRFTRSPPEGMAPEGQMIMPIPEPPPPAPEPPPPTVD